MNIEESILELDKKHKNEKSKLTRKQNKEYIEFVEDKLNSLYEPKLKDALFSFYSRVFKAEYTSIKELLKKVKKDELQMRIIEIYERDENLYCFRTLYNALSEDAKNELKMLFSNNFKKEDDIDLETELFIKDNIILITMEKFTQQKVFQLLKQTTFFESERLQKFIFGNNKQSVDYYKQIMKQYSIDSF